VLSNSQLTLPALEVIIERAYRMFRERAYVYQYEKFGLEAEDLVESFCLFEQVLSDYRML